MKKSALQCLILTCLFVAALCWRNMLVKQSMTWSDARDYCMEHNGNLTSISNEQEDEELRNYPDRDDKVWIGLHKDKHNIWMWAGREKATFFRWSKDISEQYWDKCVMHTDTGWQNRNCEHQHHFFCSNSSLVLVKENKTWEEALEQCRHQGRDLVSLPSESALKETLVASRGAQTDHVWTGLRYLADSWLWVSGGPTYGGDLSHVTTPQCPGWVHRCGALSLQGKTVEGWDCTDKLNFVCDNDTLS